jgi:hypothetical protein
MTDDRRIGESFEIVTDPEMVIAALRDRAEHGQRRNGRKVITVWPPFTGESHAEHRFSQTGNQWPSEMSPEPLDLNLDVFLDESSRDVAYSEENGGIGETKREWTAEVRASLREKIDINEFTDRPSTYVDVCYASDE